MSDTQTAKTGTTTRPIFIPNRETIGVIEQDITFDWHMGMSKAVRQRSVKSLHEKAAEQGFCNILEASSKSEQAIGLYLSAFFLKNEEGIPVENLFQSSKVFENGGPFSDLKSRFVAPRDAKKDERLRNHGEMTEFRFNGQSFPLEPKSLFYDWLYIKTLFGCDNNTDLKNAFADSRFDAFSDIEFNPKKSFSCQARTLALAVSLHLHESIKDFIRDPAGMAEQFALYRKHAGDNPGGQRSLFE